MAFSRLAIHTLLLVSSCASRVAVPPADAPAAKPPPVAIELSAEVLEDGGTMHFADRVTVRERSKGSVPLVLTTAVDAIEKGGELLPLFGRWLGTDEPRTVLLLGWTSLGGGMQTVHAWIVRVPDNAAPVVVTKLAWTTDRGSAGLVIDSSKPVRVGVPWAFDGTPLHEADEWKLEIGSRTQWLEEVKTLSFAKTESEVVAYPHGSKESKIDMYKPPFYQGVIPAGTRIAWFTVTPSGFRAP